MTNNQGWQWWVGRDEEVFTYGPMETRDEAIQVGKSDLNGEFFLVEARQDNIELSDWFDVVDLLDKLDDLLYEQDLGGPNGEISTYNVTRDQQNDLQVIIRSAIATWQTKHGIVIKPWRFTGKRNLESFGDGVVLDDYARMAAT